MRRLRSPDRLAVSDPTGNRRPRCARRGGPRRSRIARSSRPRRPTAGVGLPLTPARVSTGGAGRGDRGVRRALRAAVDVPSRTSTSGHHGSRRSRAGTMLARQPPLLSELTWSGRGRRTERPTRHRWCGGRSWRLSCCGGRGGRASSPTRRSEPPLSGRSDRVVPPKILKVSSRGVHARRDGARADSVSRPSRRPATSGEASSPRPGSSRATGASQLEGSSSPRRRHLRDGHRGDALKSSARRSRRLGKSSWGTRARKPDAVRRVDDRSMIGGGGSRERAPRGSPR